ncbi:MAG: DUF4293 domain-containing protein [Bacteroidales bacterium]|nr:DUF4293 domain-containing protein [Bacteroidales bacterium]
MLQRIQSIYLLAATSLFIVLFRNPVSRISVSDQLIMEMNAFKIYVISGSGADTIVVWPFTFLLSIVMIIGIVSIFLYKKRTLQMRLCMYNIFLMLGLVGIIWFYTKFTLNDLDGIQSVYLWPIVIPFISSIFTYLAMKSIQKDDAIVKSYERLR